MSKILHILLDSSASMGEMGKFRLAISTAADIKRWAINFRDDLEEIKAWRLDERLITPFDTKTPPDTILSLPILLEWLKERNPEEECVMLMSDGLFEDYAAVEEIQNLLRASGLPMVAIGIGPDRDMGKLAKISSSGISYSVCDVWIALQEILGLEALPGNLAELMEPFFQDDGENP